MRFCEDHPQAAVSTFGEPPIDKLNGRLGPLGSIDY